MIITLSVPLIILKRSLNVIKNKYNTYTARHFMPSSDVSDIIESLIILLGYAQE
jgi:hypothetical protein